MRYIKTLAVVFAGLMLAGCGPVDGDDVSVEFLTWKDTEKLVAENRGKVVVIDLWSIY